MPAPRPNYTLSLAAKARYLGEEYAFKHLLPTRMVEQTPFPHFFQRAGRLRALGEMLTLNSRGLLKLICVFSDTHSAFLRHFGLPAAVIPMGYHTQFGERLSNLERDIDVVFLGSRRDKRRQKIIAELDWKLRSEGISFVIKDGSPEHGYVFREERTKLLNRSKIMLNIMRQPWDDPIFRLLLAAPNSAMLLSEMLLPTSTGPFQPGKHFVMSDLEGLIESIKYYISDDEKRQEITKDNFDFVTQELTMKNMAQKVLDALALG